MNKILTAIYITITFPLVYFYNAAVSINDTLDEMRIEYKRLINGGCVFSEDSEWEQKDR